MRRIRQRLKHSFPEALSFLSGRPHPEERGSINVAASPSPLAPSVSISRRPLPGILGGLGPRAHIVFEGYVLDAAARLLGAARDQDFPPWILASVAGTPDRTRALRGGGDDPRPALWEGFGRLARAGADFAVVTCVTAHAFLIPSAARPELPLPVMDLPGLAARSASTIRRAGLLATTGTLESRLFQRAFVRLGKACLAPFDLPDGRRWQEELVMAAIYGDISDQYPGGIKGNGPTPELIDRLFAAGRRLVDAGADALVAGCTEISLAAGRLADAGVPIIDPLRAGADALARYWAGLPPGAGDDAQWEGCFLS